MSHFTNVSFSGPISMSGEVFGFRLALGTATVTGTVSHDADGSFSARWQMAVVFTLTTPLFGTLTVKDSISGVEKGSAVDATVISFQSIGAYTQSSHIWNVARDGTTITDSSTWTLNGFPGSLSGDGTFVSESSLFGDEGNNVIGGTSRDELIDGRGGDDQLSGGGGNDRILGGTGNDTLDGGTGNNMLDGGDDNDTVLLAGVLADYRISIFDGPNTGKLFYTLNGLEPGDVVNLVGKDGRIDRVVGVEKVKFLGDNSELQFSRDQFLKDAPVYAGAKYFADTTNSGVVNGSAGDDVLDGLEGNDAMTGGLGNDIYVVDSLGDTVTELLNQGNADQVKTALAALTLADNVERLEYTGSGNFSGTGNDSPNRITGGAGNDTLDGGKSADTLIGGAGDDTYMVDRAGTSSVLADGSVLVTAGDVVNEGTLANDSGGTDTVKTTLKSYTLGANLENLVFIGETGNFVGTGNLLPNQITGGAGADTLKGGLGSDRLIGGAGNDTLIGGDIAGTVGEDTVVLTGARADYTFSRMTDAALNAAIQVKHNTTLETDTLIGIEKVVFSDLLAGAALTKDDLLKNTGSPFPDSYEDDDKPETIVNFSGLAGNDTITGGARANLLDGGDGNDTMEGGGGDDTLSGGNGNDSLGGGAGKDTMSGGRGDDTYVVDADDNPVVENLAEGSDTVRTALSSYVLPDNVEKLEYAGSGGFSGTGNALANTLKGGTWNDTLDGGAGADRMEGGAGNDTYVVDRVASADGTLPGDVVFEGTALLDSGGTDTVNASVGYVLGVNLENLVLTGAANLNGTGNALANTITGNAGNNVLAGLGGDDTFIASVGNDTYIGALGNDTLNLAAMPFTFAEKSKPGGFKVERPDTNTVVITDLDTQQKLTVKGAWGALTADRGIETFVFSDQAGVTLDQLIVNTASAFADTFTGAAGVDVFAGLAGNDTYVIDDAGDVVTELAGQGIDMVKTALATMTLADKDNVEKLEYTGTEAFSGTGNALANTLKGGALNDALDGGLGADRMEGGAGDDTYTVDRATTTSVLADGSLLIVPGDVIVEVDGGGTDTVNASVSTALAINVENLVLTGTANLNGTGNTQDNTLTGNDGNNVLNGAGGNDTLNGRVGNDTLRGGAGNDTFVFDNLASTDWIADFVGSGVDRIQLDQNAFGDLLWQNGSLADGQFESVTDTSAASAGMHLVYNSRSGQLFYDADGFGAGNAEVLVVILGATTHPALVAADFMQG